MYIHRIAFQKLVDWKVSNNRKPLIIRGARQVGKTTLIRHFAKELFNNYLELNLERENDRKLFELDDIDKILNAAYLLKRIKTTQKPTLLFIDEIQESPKAISLLRYFHEEKPDIYVIAAGSLLEFSLKKVQNFPVGRVDYLYLHPLNFEEFLHAIGQKEVIKALHTIPVPDYTQKILLDLFHEYAVIGGMPECLEQYAVDKNIASLTKIYNRLWQSYKDDVEKYAQNQTERKVIRHIMETAASEPDRIKFVGFGKSNYKSREVGEALNALDMARIISLIYPTTNIEPPVISNLKRRPRLQFIDTGLLNKILLLQGEMIGINDLNDFYRGKIIQHLVTQELLSVHMEISFKPNFWVREEKDTNSEVDLVYRHGSYIIPIEIKSGKQGRLRSLHQFVERTNHPYAVRMSANEFAVEKVKTPAGVQYLLMNLPYYLGTLIPQYLDYFLKNYRL